MMKLKLIAAAAVLSAACAVPAMAQEATQEPGMIGLNYPNSHYMTGGYAYVGPSYVVPGYAPGVGVGPVVGVGPAYDAYAHDPY